MCLQSLEEQGSPLLCPLLRLRRVGLGHRPTARHHPSRRASRRPSRRDGVCGHGVPVSLQPQQLRDKSRAELRDETHRRSCDLDRDRICICRICICIGLAPRLPLSPLPVTLAVTAATAAVRISAGSRGGMSGAPPSDACCGVSLSRG